MIRLFLNRNHYNEWMFIFQGQGAGGGRGGPVDGPDGPGQRAEAPIRRLPEGGIGGPWA